MRQEIADLLATHGAWIEMGARLLADGIWKNEYVRAGGKCALAGGERAKIAARAGP